MSSHLINLSKKPPRAALAAAFALCILLFSAADATSADCTLLVSPVSVTAGNEVDVNVTLNSNANPSAIAFTIEYDSQKLSLLSGSGISSPAVTVETAPSFASAIFTGPGPGQIGVAIFPDPYTNQSIGNGTIVQLRLLAARTASGLAFVRIASSPPPSASTQNQQLLTIANGADDSGVSVTPLTPLVAVSPSSLDFGSVQQGSSIRKQVSIADDGNAPATISSISIEGDPSFSIASSPTMPWLMNADDNTSVTVQFNASGEGASAATLRIGTAAGDSVVVPLLGTSSTDPSTIYGTRRLVPAVARLQEADGSSWASELIAFNSTDFDAGMRLTYRPADGSAQSVVELEIPAHQTQQFGDVLGQPLGISSGSGALVVETSTPDVQLRSTTYHRPAGGGALPETVPAIDWVSLFHTGEQASLPLVDFSAASRTSVALVNLAGVATGFDVQLIRQDGSVAGTSHVSLAPGEIAGRIDPSGGAAITDPALTVVISPTTSNALYFAYASTVDLQSGAPIYLSPR